jgi:cytochrome P450
MMSSALERDVYYDPYDIDINTDPYPTFRRLRDEAPIYYNEKYDVWALSRHADVERGFSIGRRSRIAAATSSTSSNRGCSCPRRSFSSRTRRCTRCTGV